MNVFKRKLICTNEFGKLRSVLFVSKRYKYKKSEAEDNSPCNKALIHFDDFYQAVFGERWPSVRLALLSKQKQVAVINNFGDVEKTEELFLSQGAFDLRCFLEAQKSLIKEQKKPQNIESNDKNALDEIITKQLKDQEIKEASSLHLEGVEFKSEADLYERDDNKDEMGEYVYKPEDARTSLEVDLNKAQIDMSRLILPDSKTNQANLGEFIPTTVLRGVEEFIAESEYYKFYQPKMKLQYNIEEEQELDFPEKLKVFSFDRGDTTDFSDPTRSIIKVYNYLKLDGAELLPALALNVQPNDVVLDACSTSGNIAYCIFQTFRPKLLVCAEDIHEKTADLFSEHLFDFSPLWKDILYVTKNPVSEIGIDIDFNKILVNVPSTNDKASLFDKENNIFHPLRIKGRLQLPQHQASLLLEGLKLVRPGGTVVYTSSTLSPIQNDGVVNHALKVAQEENGLQFIIKDLTPALRHMTPFFNFADYLNLKFGTLVVPFLPINFGPRYICKLVKKENKMINLP